METCGGRGMSETVSITVEKLHPVLGARIHGVDMRRKMDPATFKAVHDAWMEHLVVVFPGQHITDDEHIAFTRHFGTPEIFHQTILKSRTKPEIFRVSNVDDDNNLMPAAHKTVKQLNLSRMWHTDSSYRTLPCIGSLLHGIEISKTGGQTRFTNMYAVYDALPESLRKQVDGRRALHDFGHLAVLQDIRPATAEEKAAMPPVWQPMVRSHPVTGRRCLSISPIYNDEVEGMPQVEARKLIADLTEFAGQERFVYTHYWTTDDVLMWDNRCTMHQVTAHDPNERRVMHRTTIEGDAPVLAA